MSIVPDRSPSTPPLSRREAITLLAAGVALPLHPLPAAADGGLPRPAPRASVDLLTCAVAGAWYRDVSPATAHAIARGTPLGLVREPENRHDPDAVRVEAPDGTPLGYVPRRQVTVLARLLDAGERLVGRTETVEIRDRAADRPGWPCVPGLVVDLAFTVRWER